MNKKAGKKNPQDLTLRNARAWRKELKRLNTYVDQMFNVIGARLELHSRWLQEIDAPKAKRGKK